MLRPVERWVESKIMSPLAYLTVAVYYFLYSVVDQKKKWWTRQLPIFSKSLKATYIRSLVAESTPAEVSWLVGSWRAYKNLRNMGSRWSKLPKWSWNRILNHKRWLPWRKWHQKLYRFLSWRSQQGNLEGNGGKRTKIKRTMMRSQWFTKLSAYREHWGVNSEISKILRFSRRGVTKRWDLTVAVTILENSDVRRLELWDLAAKTKLLGTESCRKRPRTVYGIQIRSLNHDRPPSMCLEEVHSFWQYILASVH